VGNVLARALERVGTPRDVLERYGIEVRGRVALCPFHLDTNPSLSLFTGEDGKERWRCHGCDQHGDALDLEDLLSEGGAARREAEQESKRLLDRLGPEEPTNADFITPAHLLSHTPTPVQWAIPNLAIRGQVTFFYGLQKAGKTTLYQDALMAAVTGHF
jgi:hypothetical protein